MMPDELENRFILLLSILELGGRASKQQVLDNIAVRKYYRLEPEELRLRKHGEEAWRNNLAFIRHHLVKEGHLNGTQFDDWQITKEGVLHFRTLAIMLKGGDGVAHKITPIAIDAGFALSNNQPQLNACSVSRR